jgi:hypothetical protein
VLPSVIASRNQSLILGYAQGASSTTLVCKDFYRIIESAVYIIINHLPLLPPSITLINSEKRRDKGGRAPYHKLCLSVELGKNTLQNASSRAKGAWYWPCANLKLKYLNSAVSHLKPVTLVTFNRCFSATLKMYVTRNDSLCLTIGHNNPIENVIRHFDRKTLNSLGEHAFLGFRWHQMPCGGLPMPFCLQYRSAILVKLDKY